MASVGLIFPGQGAQYVGMGKDLYESFPGAKKVFEQGNRILGFDLTRLCFEGPEEVLMQTENAQPAILLVSLAALEVWKEVYPNVLISTVCGLSAGEFTALVAAGSLTFESALKLVRKRGVLMAEAAIAHPGTMASIIGLTYEQCVEVGKASGASLANINSPTQIVVSGTKESVERAGVLAKEKGAKKVIPLKVSGAFHSPLMDDAARGLRQILKDVNITQPQNNIQFIANVTGASVKDPEAIREGLERQVVSSVKWVTSIETVADLAVRRCYEVGPGTVLKGLVGRINKALNVVSWGTTQDIRRCRNSQEEMV